MIKKIKELTEILNNARKAYYQENKQLMSDFEYDKLYDELYELEKKSGITLSNSPTINVGYKIISKLNKVKHSKKMLSLDKTKEISKLEDFLNDKEAILSLKIDGLTIVLIYENGELKQAITRGNGDVGEDVTHNVSVFKNVPLKIPFDKKLIIRGEAVISFDEFKKINEKLNNEEKYKNPRNLCSGTVRQLNNKITGERNVNYIAFSLVENINNETLKSNQLNFLKNLGFDIVEYKIVNKTNVASTVKYFEKIVPLNKFATDGLVLTFNDINYSNSLGSTSKFPKDSIAFKWSDDLAETILLNVEWNTSRTGLINPIAIFEPVELEGTTVNRASLHNISVIKNLSLGIGDKISVYKANMIIPQIAENFTKSNNLEIPTNCPVCNEETEIINIRDGYALKCTNPNCNAKLIQSITHYVSRDAMNIEGFSEATIEKFIENGILSSYSDIYFIENFKDKIIEMRGFGEKSYFNLIQSIEKSKNVYLSNFIYALGIDEVGISNAKLLVKYFKGDFNKIINCTDEDLINIEGFGKIISNSVVSYFKNKENLKNLNIVLEKINILKENFDLSNLILKEKIFVITGSLEIFKNRKELTEKIESLGGKVSSSISSKTNYLINNDINSNSSKNKKANELNIPIISEQDFLKLINKV